MHLPCGTSGKVRLHCSTCPTTSGKSPAGKISGHGGLVSSHQHQLAGIVQQMPDIINDYWTLNEASALVWHAFRVCMHGHYISIQKVLTTEKVSRTQSLQNANPQSVKNKNR